MRGAERSIAQYMCEYISQCMSVWCVYVCVYKSIYVIRRGLDRVATARRANIYMYKVCVQITYTRISVYKVYVYMCVCIV